jgi:hypothetical protein
MEAIIYDWKVTARKGAAWAGATFLAGVLGAVEAGQIQPRSILYAGGVAVLVGTIQGLRNYQKITRLVKASAPAK